MTKKNISPVFWLIAVILAILTVVLYVSWSGNAQERQDMGRLFALQEEARAEYLNIQHTLTAVLHAYEQGYQELLLREGPRWQIAYEEASQRLERIWQDMEQAEQDLADQTSIPSGLFAEMWHRSDDYLLLADRIWEEDSIVTSDVAAIRHDLDPRYENLWAKLEVVKAVIENQLYSQIDKARSLKLDFAVLGLAWVVFLVCFLRSMIWLLRRG